jgi:decaprenylphospho-beta-D-ribofuranose 2-oxidase
MKRAEIAGWGNFPKVESEIETPKSESEFNKVHSSLVNYIPRGAGRSYGDPALNVHVLDTRELSDTIDFNIKDGSFTCKTGKMLGNVLDEIVPNGYFLPVTPGTKFVTIGGMIAADVHGKNHHVDGCFSQYLIWFRLMTADGNVITCSKTENTDLFWATCGGMGLTGIILEASFRLKRIETSKIVNRTIKCANLNETIDGLIKNENYTYSVAWVDCVPLRKNLGRSLIYLGEHATKPEVPDENLDRYKTKTPKMSMPFNFPNWILNNQTSRLFNALYYGKVQKTDSTSIVGLDEYFYPLDALKNWNRLYGSSGFIQYQVVIPVDKAKEGMSEILSEIADEKEKPRLAVLKLFGEQNSGWLSFPQRGIQIALDFRRNEQSFALMNRLDDLVLSLNGRAYLAKDARMNRSFFEAGYPKLGAFKQLLSEIDPKGKCRSLQSARLGITMGEKNVLILGANSDIGKAIGYQFASNGFGLMLAVRNPKNENEILFDATDFDSHDSFVQGLKIVPDVVVVAFGVLPDAEKSFENPEVALESTLINYTGVVSILGHLSTVFAQRGSGTIIGISSVAGDRGRGSNYVYGSAKAGMSTYLDGLRNFLVPKGVHVITVKPGFVNTKMTRGIKLPPLLTASSEQVAAEVYRAYEKKLNTVYVLPVWRFIMLTIRSIPEFIFKTMSL